jgi:hypothetical protein
MKAKLFLLAALLAATTVNAYAGNDKRYALKPAQQQQVNKQAYPSQKSHHMHQQGKKQAAPGRSSHKAHKQQGGRK